MTLRSAVHILVPGLFGPLPAVDQLAGRPDAPLLERCLARADQLPAPGRDLESTLCGLFGVERRTGGDYPIAAVQRLGAGAEPDDRFWLQAIPVCLRPDQDRLLLFDTRDFDFPTSEADALGSLFRDHFEQQGLKLQLESPHEWYLSPEDAPDITTYGLGEVFGRNMDIFLPTGREALQWHALLNEIQMLFFNAPVNQQREAEGKMPVSGLWFSGGGRLPAGLEQRFDQIYTYSNLARGLARLSNTEPSDLVESEDELLETPGRKLLLYPALERPVWRADPFDWSEEIEAFEHWLNARLDAGGRARADEFWIYPCNGRVFRSTAGSRRRFWRRRRPLTGRLDSD